MIQINIQEDSVDLMDTYNQARWERFKSGDFHLVSCDFEDSQLKEIIQYIPNICKICDYIKTKESENKNNRDE